ncbi:neutrophil gelatinase-associated lipocalin-like [Octodon degus]|uniref:Neutrophil gelatinase-associated lipocalin-like n=1 Tax=Octodon degus TaxID=10160 RepID=A0A6P6DBH1_OCTDE|nr:neutrophil gelatinase-associated lipocalin-like [Octodon degus]
MFFPHQNFNYSWAQGKWYAIAIADAAIKNGAKKKINMHSVFFNATDDHGYLFTTIMYRPFLPIASSKPIMVNRSHRECDRWIRKFSPTKYPRNFVIEYPCRPHGLQRYNMIILSTNYNEYALVGFEQKFHDKEYIHLMLYGRTKTQKSLMKKRFISFAKKLDFTEDNIIFFIPIEKCIDDS